MSQFWTEFGARGQQRGESPAFSILVLFIRFFSFVTFLDPSSFHISVTAASLHSRSGDIPVWYLAGDLPFVGPLPSPGMFAACTSLGSLDRLHFFDPQFRAGKIHTIFWCDHNASQVDLMEIVSEGVKI